MNDADKNKLLNDLLSEGAFDAHNLNSRDAALQAFGRRRQQRRLYPAAIALCAVMIFTLGYAATRSRTHTVAVKIATTVAPQKETIPSPKKRESFLMTDEELLAYLPPGSCVLGSSGGKTFLLFHNEQTRRELFHEP
jgi:hypothetical protein